MLRRLTVYCRKKDVFNNVQQDSPEEALIKMEAVLKTFDSLQWHLQMILSCGR